MLGRIFRNVVDSETYVGTTSAVKEPSALGKLVKKHRDARGMTQGELADAVGVDAQTVSNLETGNTGTLQMKFARKLGTALEVPLEQVIEATVQSRRRRRPSLVPLMVATDVAEVVKERAAREGLSVSDFLKNCAASKTASKNAGRSAKSHTVSVFNHDGGGDGGEADRKGDAKRKNRR